MSVWESKGRSTIGARCLFGGRTVVYRSDARHSVRARFRGPLGLNVYESRVALPNGAVSELGKLTSCLQIEWLGQRASGVTYARAYRRERLVCTRKSMHAHERVGFVGVEGRGRPSTDGEEVEVGESHSFNGLRLLISEYRPRNMQENGAN
jgi:hypothetical protein